jgi:hypothetical protein
MSPFSGLWYLYEKCRIFPDGYIESRHRFLRPGKKGEYIPVAFSESKKKGEPDLIGRAFWEEWGRAIIARERLIIEDVRLPEVHPSVAFEGMYSMTWGDTCHYLATTSEAALTEEIRRTDEDNVITVLAWERQTDMRKRRSIFFKPPLP